jgi:CTP:phosphocholine cytidylyltransferase-like protein
MVELTNIKADKEMLKQTLKNLDLYNKKNTLALFVNANKVAKAKEFIRNHYNEILLEDNNVFIWKSDVKESLLFVKDEYKSIEIGSLVLWIEQNDSITKIKFSSDSKRILSGFSMKHLNRPILLEINGELVTTVKSFGRLEDGILEIKNR